MMATSVDSLSTILWLASNGQKYEKQTNYQLLNIVIDVPLLSWQRWDSKRNRPVAFLPCV